MDYLKALQLIFQILGNVTLEEAITWAQVRENAERLRAEGHDVPEVPEEEETPEQPEEE